MKVIYSEIKKLVPGLKAMPLDVGRVLTMTGFMMDGFKEITYRGKKDYVLSFEVRQNRADCFSFIGLAREIGGCVWVGAETIEGGTYSRPGAAAVHWC